MSRNSETHNRRDIDECNRKIKAILDEYNCQVETDDYHSCWLYDRDTEETTGLL